MKLVKLAFAGVALVAASQTFAAEEVTKTTTPVEAPAVAAAASEAQATDTHSAHAAESAASEVQAPAAK